MADPTSAIRKPSVEQLVYYRRLTEGEDGAQRQAREQHFQDDLRSLAAHLENVTGSAADWRPSPRQTRDPYVSQPIATIGWLLGEDRQGAFLARARTYADGYVLHVRYLWRGEWHANVFATVMHSHVWQPNLSDTTLGQQLVYSGIARPEDGHPLAAQILRMQMPPRTPIGEMQTCGFGQSRIFRGSNKQDLAVFLYAQEDLEWAVDHFLIGWLPRWEFHYRQLVAQLAWCDQVAGTLEDRASQLREAVRHGLIANVADDRWPPAVQTFSEQLAVLLRRENAIQVNLENLRWLMGQVKITGPDTYFASSIRTLRAQSQELVTRLVGWRRTRDELARTLAERGEPDAEPLRGDPAGLHFGSEPPTLNALRAARDMPPWPSQGWMDASAMYLPDNSHAVPDWHRRRYDMLQFAIRGPRSARGYALDVTSSVWGQFAGTMIPPGDDLEFEAYLDAIASGRTDAGTIRTVGELAFRSLMGADRELLYRRALEQARATGRGLALRLCISQAPELEALPWECLYDPTEDAYLAASAETPLARVIDPRAVRDSRNADLPLRVLTATAAPQDAPSRFGLSQQEADIWASAVRERLSALQEAGLLRFETVRAATRSSLMEAAARSRPHVIELCAFGVLRRDEPNVLLQSASRGGRLAGPRFLQEVISAPETQLLVISSPEGASQDSASALWQVALQLASRATCAIMAPYRAAIPGDLFCELVRALASGTPVDVAVAEARRRTLMEGGGESRGWETPALFLPTLSAQFLYVESQGLGRLAGSQGET